MLRAALIGLPATGKTTLFQLMTAVREAGRAAQGRGEVQIGVSKVPDPRLDHLTAMFTPREAHPGHGGVRRSGGCRRERQGVG